MSTSRPSTAIYHLTVTLLSVKPAVWRRLQVLGSTTLADLHLIVQIVMGWYNCHLYEFTYQNAIYSEPDPEIGWHDTVDDARRMTLATLLPAGEAGLRYRYDLGDHWEHQIRVLRITPPQPGVVYPRCLAGKGACPPEDCGGPLYYTYLRAGDQAAAGATSFGPASGVFDLDGVNERLRQPLAEFRRQIDPELLQDAPGGSQSYQPEVRPLRRTR